MNDFVCSPITLEHKVRFVEIPGVSNRFQVIPPIWHPLVWWPNSTIDKEDVYEFTTSVNFPNPANLDAAIQWHKDRKSFHEKNTIIRTIVNNPEECCICFEVCNQVQFTCFKNHYCCKSCSESLDACPICRFIPFEKRGKNLMKEFC